MGCRVLLLAATALGLASGGICAGERPAPQSANWNEPLIGQRVTVFLHVREKAKGRFDGLTSSTCRLLTSAKPPEKIAIPVDQILYLEDSGHTGMKVLAAIGVPAAIFGIRATLGGLEYEGYAAADVYLAEGAIAVGAGVGAYWLAKVWTRHRYTIQRNAEGQPILVRQERDARAPQTTSAGAAPSRPFALAFEQSCCQPTDEAAGPKESPGTQ